MHNKFIDRSGGLPHICAMLQCSNEMNSKGLVSSRFASPSQIVQCSSQNIEGNYTMATTKKTASAKSVQETFETVAEAQKKSFDDALQAGTDTFAKGYEEFYNSAREQLAKAQQSIFGNFDEVSDFNRENVEAAIVSSNIVAKGFEVVGKEFAAYAQQAIEANMAAAKNLSTAKDPQELMDLQSEWAKSAFDGFVAESSKLQDISVKVSNQASQPINERINKAVETFTKTIAA